MGAGPTKIDYKERNFTKQPLTDEEIDVLMKSIPKDDILGSLNQEDKEMIMNNYPVDNLIQRLEQPEREKIVKAMSNEKMFNLRGDSIFDYYFTNNKSELKRCMKGHINKDGTLCEDEKFKKMITTMPDLVMGPLREKQSQWDTEQNTLQTQWGAEKKGLEAQLKKLKNNPNVEAPKTIVTTEGKQDYSMTETDCYNYSVATGSNFYLPRFDKQNSGNLRTKNPKEMKYYITEEGEVEKDHINELKCKSYAEKNNHEYEGFVELGVSSPGACILKDNKVSYNLTVGGWGNYADCSPTEKCIKMKRLEDRVGGCNIANNVFPDWDRQVYFYDRKFITNLCDPKSHDENWKNSRLCVKKWKDYKPDETDTTNFKKDDYKEYAPFLEFMEKAESLGETKEEASNIWLNNIENEDNKKELVELRDNIRNNIKHISENECRVYAGEDASKYFVRNNQYLPKGCVRQKKMRFWKPYIPGPDPNFGKIFYNYTDKQIFKKRAPFQEKTIKYYDKESDSFKEHKIGLYDNRFTTIVKK